VRAGWDLLDRLGAEATTVGIPVVVVSTDPRLLARAEADWSGAGDRRFVVKPFDLEELLATVRALAGPA
jgi:DNA-binding response OmpR family regulator